MNVRKICYSIDDVKIKCTHCGNKLFGKMSPAKYMTNNKTDYLCPHCGRGDMLDFNEKKEWYGNYDGKKEVYDYFYLDSTSDYIKVKDELEQIFKDAIFENTSDGIHGSRLGISLREDINVYRKIIIEKGLALISFNFRMFMHMEPVKAKKLFEEYKKEQENAKKEKCEEILS